MPTEPACVKRAAVFVARFRETARLHTLLTTIVQTLSGSCTNASIHVINNNPADLLVNRRDLVPDGVSVHDNSLRLTRSHGQLARTWNEAIINAFGNLAAPNVDVLVTMQADAVLKATWWTVVHSALKSCALLSFGRGDEMVVYTPEAVRRVGLWDERFTSLTHQEYDYFFRAALALSPRACMTDHLHSRLLHRRNASGVLDLKSPYGFKRMVTHELGPQDELLRNAAQQAFSDTWELLLDKWCPAPPSSPIACWCACALHDNATAPKGVQGPVPPQQCDYRPLNVRSMDRTDRGRTATGSLWDLPPFGSACGDDLAALRSPVMGYAHWKEAAGRARCVRPRLPQPRLYMPFEADMLTDDERCSEPLTRVHGRAESQSSTIYGR